MRTIKKGERAKRNFEIGLVIVGLLVTIFSMTLVFAADPVGPDDLVHVSNTTKAATAAQMVNISGGYVATFNLTATIQNPRWKAFIGNVTGSYTLDDSSGSTIFDWTLASVTGRIYATRYSSTVGWSTINCSNTTYIEQENTYINHSNADDNITATFDGSTHGSFWVGGTFITANQCPTLNTYKNNASQDTDFEEMILYDYSANNVTVYATIMEEDVTGYNGNSYDFQMIVPENGAPGFSGATAYYLYVEIGT